MACKSSTDAQVGQPFPRSNRRTIIVDKPWPESLKDEDEQVFSYKLTTLSKAADEFVQDGNAPNYQGNRITLCTCMHWHRASIRAGMWIAGFGGKACGKDNELFYLMKVAAVFDDFAEVWDSELLPNRQAKSASSCIYGDLYVPKSTASTSPHDPTRFQLPLLGHKHRKNRGDYLWHKDINLWRPDLNKTRRRRPLDPRVHKLLVGKAGQSFLWRVPMYRYKGGHPRQQRPTLAVFLKHLEKI